MGFRSQSQLGDEGSSDDMDGLDGEGRNQRDCQIEVYCESFFSLVVCDDGVLIKRKEYRVGYAVFGKGLV